MVYDAVRHWSYLVWFTGDRFSFKRDGLWQLGGSLLLLKAARIARYQEFASLNRPHVAERVNRRNLPRVIRQSVSRNVDALAVEQMGEEAWERELQAMNVPADVVLRVNTLQTDKASLAAAVCWRTDTRRKNCRITPTH